MAKTSTKVKQLKINYLSKDQYNDALEAGEIQSDELYFTPSNEIGIGTVTTAGTVKSGGDITIDSTGVVSVNDNSHNHTISNITGLQDELDGKATSEQGSKADTAVQPSDLTVYAKTSDIPSWAMQSSKPTYIASEIGLGNVENKSSETIRSEITKDNITSGLGYTPYTPNEIDNKLSAIETNIDWKESVSTYDDIIIAYPNPEDGWTVNVKDTDYTYRYSGTNWVTISANAIPKATNSVDGLLSKEDHTDYDDANNKKHTHDNKSLLDTISSTLIDGWNNAVTHLSDTIKHITSTERTNWNTAYNHSQTSHAPSNAEANQNAFSNISVGTSTISADSPSDTLNLVAGSNITITSDTTNDKVTIASTDTIYTHPSYTPNDSGLYKVKIDNTGHVSSVSSVTKSDITNLGVPSQDTTYLIATTSSDGLLSSSDKTKLDSIEENANNYTHPSYTSKPSGLYKMTVDSTGHISAATAVTKSDITALGIPSSDTDTHYESGTVINNSPTATTNSTTVLSNGNVYINHIENNTVKNSHKISGSGNTTVTTDTSGNIVISSTDNNTTYSAGTGLSLSGTTFNHSNSVTAGTAQGDASKTLSFGGTFAVPTVSYDAQGHVTGKGTTTMTMPATPTTISGNAGSATKATQDSAGQQINTTYIKGLSVSGTTITYTKGDGTTGTITTQDTNTTYSTATTTSSGLTKLYTSTGTATDGTMTQNAITTELNGKTKVKIVRWS